MRVRSAPPPTENKLIPVPCGDPILRRAGVLAAANAASGGDASSTESRIVGVDLAICHSEARKRRCDKDPDCAPRRRSRNAFSVDPALAGESSGKGSPIAATIAESVGEFGTPGSRIAAIFRVNAPRTRMCCGQARAIGARRASWPGSTRRDPAMTHPRESKSNGRKSVMESKARESVAASQRFKTSIWIGPSARPWMN